MAEMLRVVSTWSGSVGSAILVISYFGVNTVAAIGCTLVDTTAISGLDIELKGSTTTGAPGT